MTPATIDDASAQLKRLLLAIATLGDDQPHRLVDVAELVGTTEEVLARDLRTLVTRFDDAPGGFIEGVRLAFHRDTVQLESNLLRRPMGLSPDELVALELGLAALEQELPPHEAKVAASARQRVCRAATVASVESDGAATHAASFNASDRDGAHLSLLRTAIAERKKAAIRYRSAAAEGESDRAVHPHGLVFARGRWYLVGHCELVSDIRIFRLDRMTAVTLLTDEAEVPESLDFADRFDDGRVLSRNAEERLRVSYSPRIARWIAEGEQVSPQLDGSVVVEHPLLDDEWAVHHVLQYGPDATVLSPARIQVMLRERLAGILGA